MSTLLQIVIIALFVLVLYFLIDAFLNRVFNVIALFRKPKIADVAEREDGIIFNPETKELEADQSRITPF